LEEVDEIKHHPFFNGIDWEALSLKKLPSPFKIEMVRRRKKRKETKTFFFSDRTNPNKKIRKRMTTSPTSLGNSLRRMSKP
jgi:hypothetical protein